MTEDDTHRRPGRWRSGAGSRQRVLAAARELFAQHGYGGTTVRAIATAAGVDPAVVFYFSGTEQGLFSAVIDLSDTVPAAIESVFTGDPDTVGERRRRSTSWSPRSVHSCSTA
jgi:AcrR family transcriptional regulator